MSKNVISHSETFNCNKSIVACPPYSKYYDMNGKLKRDPSMCLCANELAQYTSGSKKYKKKSF